MIGYAVHDRGAREVIGLDLGEVESEAFWTEFLRGLRARGLTGLRLVVSDRHEDPPRPRPRADGDQKFRCDAAD